MPMPRRNSETLQSEIVKAMRRAVNQFQEAQKTEIEEFTAYGFKETKTKGMWLAYVCTNIKTSTSKDNELNNQVLQQWIRDAVNACRRAYSSSTRRLVEIYSLKKIEKTRKGQTFTSLGFHWHTAYP